MSRGVAALRRFAGIAGGAAGCGMCGEALRERHDHVIEPALRRVECACVACALLFDRDGLAMRRVPRDVRRLDPIDDVAWAALGVPVSLAFVARWSAPVEAVVATSPSPLGGIDHAIDVDDWAALVVATPALATLRADVEALLVDRARGVAVIAPIDRCFGLVGRVREAGHDAEGAVDAFFEALR